MKRKLSISRVILAMVFIVFAFIALWFFASVIDINLHNDPFTENFGEYAYWNLFLRI